MAACDSWALELTCRESCQLAVMDWVVIPSYTLTMKTAISVPDDTFDRAERAAKKHGMNRSQFYARAADRYATDLESGDLTAAIDAVVDVVNTDESTQFAKAAGRRTITGVDDEW